MRPLYRLRADRWRSEEYGGIISLISILEGVGRLRKDNLSQKRLERGNKPGGIVSLDCMPGVLDLDPPSVRKGCNELLGFLIAENVTICASDD